MEKGLKEAYGNDGTQLYMEHVCRKRSWVVMVEYKISFPDFKSICKGVVSRMNSTDTATLNLLQKLVRHTCNQVLGLLCNLDISLEFINVPNTALKLGLRAISQTTDSGRLDEDTL